MLRLRSLILVSIILMTHRFSACKALDCQLTESKPNKVAYTITVDKSGKGNFTTVQSAIDSIPEKNTQWIRIQIAPGTYQEKVEVNIEKPCIFFQGAGRDLTVIEWGDQAITSNSSTVSFYADNILVKGITFKNTYNFDLRPPAKIEWRQAVAVSTIGDKSAFYDSAFLGLQDTFWDATGRHYIYNCYIEGSVDFIFGNGQSIYENCEIYVNIGRYVEAGIYGFITAQKKEGAEEGSGFVFKSCVISGIGKALLGRAWGAFSTVIIYGSNLSDVVSPQGWNAWNHIGHEGNFTYVEANNVGAGADTSKRVPWINKISSGRLSQFLDMSFINQDGWIEKLPQ